MVVVVPEDYAAASAAESLLPAEAGRLGLMDDWVYKK